MSQETRAIHGICFLLQTVTTRNVVVFNNHETIVFKVKNLLLCRRFKGRPSRHQSLKEKF